MNDGLVGGWLSAIILGLVEGITEFLPISSTGHLIITSHWLGENSESVKVFEIVIQLGAILAVCWHYRQRLWDMVRHLPVIGSPSSRLAINLVVAFLPAALFGLLFHRFIKEYLFTPVTVAIALIGGGIIIIIVERRECSNRINSLEALRLRDALVIGFAQSLALFPGVSRAGATIMGGLMWGVNRKVATEFSFLLALPTMIAATAFDLWQNAALLNQTLIEQIICGFVVSFLSALLVIRALLYYVSQYKFTAFGWYRLVFGMIIILLHLFYADSDDTSLITGG